MCGGGGVWGPTETLCWKQRAGTHTCVGALTTRHLGSLYLIQIYQLKRRKMDPEHVPLYLSDKLPGLSFEELPSSTVDRKLTVIGLFTFLSPSQVVSSSGCERRDAAFRGGADLSSK